MNARLPLFFLLLNVLSFLTPATTSADDSAIRETLARELVRVIGSDDECRQMVESMVVQFRDSRDYTPEFIDTFVRLADPKECVDQIVSLYAKSFDLETLQAASNFYKTPAGKKLAAGLPQATGGAMVLRQQWVNEIVLIANSPAPTNSTAPSYEGTEQLDI